MILVFAVRVIRFFFSCCDSDVVTQGDENLNLSVPNFRRHLSSAFLFFNKLSLEKKFIRKVERLNVKQRRSR